MLGDASLQAKVAANVETFQKVSTQTGQLATAIKKDRLAWEESERLRRLKEEEELKHKDEVRISLPFSTFVIVCAFHIILKISCASLSIISSFFYLGISSWTSS